MFGIKFIKFQPNEFGIEYRNGEIIRKGAGISFFYFAPRTSLVKIPLKSIEMPFMFEELTGDYQSVSVQGQVIYRIVEKEKLAQLLNYSLDIKSHNYISDDPQKLMQRVINQVQVHTKKLLEKQELRRAIKLSDQLASEVFKSVVESEVIKTLGVEILSVNLLAIKPSKETSRALEAATREEILKLADEAIYQRRNASIEQERKVKENEYNTEIAIVNKRKQVEETKLHSQQSLQQQKNAIQTEQLTFDIEQEEKRAELIELSVANTRTEAEAKAFELKAVMGALDGMNPAIIQSLSSIGMNPDQLMAVAFQHIADNASKIGQLNISPDLLQEIARNKAS